MSQINDDLELQFLRVSLQSLLKINDDFYFKNNLNFYYWVSTQLKQIEENLDDILNCSNISTIKKVKKLLYIKDIYRAIYDDIINRYYNVEIEKLYKKTNSSINNYLSNIPECNLIKTTKDMIIAQKQMKEIPTTITGSKQLCLDNIVFYGFLNHLGNLVPSSTLTDDEGLKIFISNCSIKTNDASKDLRDYFNDTITTYGYTDNCSYFIKKNSPIGLEVKELKKSL